MNRNRTKPLGSWLQTAVICLTVTTAALAQTTPAPTTTLLISNSPTLTLPGSLTLTSVVASTPTAQGVPTGNVSFSFDGSSALGTAPLKIIPSSQSFIQLAPLTINPTSTALVSAKLSNATHPDLVVGNPGPNGPEFLLYPGLGQGLFDTTNVQTYALPSPAAGAIDSSVVGSFTAPGSADVVVHTFAPSVAMANSNSTYSLLSKQANGTLAASVSVSFSLPYYAAPDSETIIADDFNGDGLSDIAYLVSGSHFGVSLNTSTSPGALLQPSTLYVASYTLPGTTTPIGFCPTTLASGKFTASGHVDLIIGATQCGIASPAPGYILLFSGNGNGGFLNTVPTEVGADVTPTAVVQVGNDPVAIAVGDVNQDGNLDVIVADQSGASINVLFGNGDGTFQSPATFSTGGTPIALALGDFNGDGFPDVAVNLSSNGSVAVLLNDGKGGFIVPATTFTTTASPEPHEMIVGDFNTDGFADIAFLTQMVNTPAPVTSANILLTSASAQAILATAPQTLPAGTHTVTATFPGDANLATSTSAGLQQVVSQTIPAITWPAPAPILYGTPLSAAQLNASTIIPGTITYTPPAGTILVPGSDPLKALFVPTDAFDYSNAMATQTLTVAAPSLATVTPATANLGDPSTTVTISGQGFLSGAVAMWVATPLATTFVDSSHLTAFIPSSLLQNVGTFAITVLDANGVPVTGSQSFSVVAPPVVVSATGPSTIGATQQSPITLSVNPYPVPLVATFTLSFTPLAPITVTDPTVLFSNGSTTFVVNIPALDSTAIPPVTFQSGSTAGTITITIRLTAGGSDITPTSLTPITITVPATPPGISAITLTRSGKTMQVAITGLSSTREVSQAQFHFVPAAGQTLTTTDVTVPLTSAFSTWYQNEASTAFGTQFLYTQPFTLDSDATVVGSVTVTLTNTQGASAPSNAQ